MQQQPAAGPEPARPTTAWVMPAEGSQRGAITGLAKLGALILILFGVLWTLIGLALIVLVGFAKSLGDQTGISGLGDLAGGVLAIFGIVILAVALVEIATGLFAWRGTGFARVVGILYGLVFGLGALLPVIGSSPTTANTDTGGGVAVLLVFAVGYLYTALVFIVRYRSRPA
jgi:hypothetical protein